MRPRGRRSLLAAAVLGASAAALLVVAPASEVAAQSTTVQFASDSVNVREGTSAQLALTLSSAAAADVTVEVTATSGTATGGDFAADPVSVTIASGAARAAFEVPVPYDGAFEGLETFAVSIDAESLPSGISLGDPAAATVRVFDVNFVPTDWSLKPSGLSAGDQFRLVFMTAAARDATAADIADYDAFVQAAAATGHNDIRDYADGFQVLGSTATVDAAQHTATNVRVNNNNSIYTPWYQIPFYWLNGSKIADDHNDLWDGSWDAQHHRDTRYQNGGGGHNVWPHTGTRTGTDGLAGTASDHPLGNTGHNVSVGVWSTDGDADTDPINGGNYSAGTPRNLLAVSSVFEVRDQTNPEIAVTSLNAPYEGRPATFRVTAFPAPAAPLTVSLTVSEDNSASQDFLDAGDEGTVTVTIAAAASSNAGTAVLKVPTVNDSIDESNGTVTVTVAPGAGYTAGRAASARAAVTDDDHTGYVVEAKKWAVNESGNGTRTELIALIGWYASRTDDQGVDLGLRERVSLRPLAAGQTVKLALTAIGATAGTHFTLALKKGSRVNDGVTLVTTSPHSPQNPALIFSGAGTSVARLILTAVDNNDRADRQIRFVADNIYYNSVGAVGGTRGGGRLSLTSKPIAIIDDENTSPTTVRFGTATTSGYEHRGPLQPVVVLSRAFGKDIPLRIAVADGTATAGDDYLLPPTLTVTIPAGVTSHSIDIPLVSDLIPEPDETLTLTMSPTGLPDGVELGTPSTNTVTIKDNPESQVGFARENYGVTEGTTVQPVLTLSRHFSEATTVRVTAAAGTAAAGDFPPGPFDVTFPPLAQKASFSVPIPYDGAVENPESFTLSVDETTLPIGLTLAAGRSTTVRIADAGVVPNNWPLKPAGLNPGDQFRLVFLSSTTRDAASADIATYDSFVQAAAAAGHTAVRDYASGFAVLGSTSTVGARDHAMTAPSGDGQPSPRTPVYWLGGAKITDDHDELWAGAWDARRATDTRNESGGAGSGEAPHTGTRSGTGTASDHPLGNTPDVTTGAWGLNKNPVSDQHRPGSAARPLLAISPVFRVGTTTSPEVAVTALNAPSEGRPARFKITASPVPAAPLTVSLTVSEDNSASQDYIAGGDQRTLTATIPGAGDPGAGAALLEVPTIDDTVDEPDGAVTVTVNSGAGYVVGRAAAAAAAVIDNENTELTFRAKKRAIYENGSGNSTEAILAIGLGNQEGVDLGIGVPVALRPLKAGQTLTVPLSFEGATAGGSHFTVALKQGPGVNTGVSLVTTRPYSDQHPAVVFSGVGASVATLVLTAVDNAERADRTISTSLPRSIRNRMTGLGGGRIRLRTPRITLSIIDDESTDPITVRFEQTNFDVHEHRGPGQPTIVLSRAHGEDIPLRIAVADVTATAGDDYLLPPTVTVTLPAGVTRHDFDITMVDDDIVEGEETFTLTIDPAGLPEEVSVVAPDAATFAILDDVDFHVTVTLTNLDKTAVEGSATDDGRIQIHLERALRLHESIVVPLQFGGGTLGEDFTVSLYGDPTGVAIDPATGAVTFTGPSYPGATFVVEALDDDDDDDETVTFSLPARLSSTRYIFLASDAGNGRGRARVEITDDDTGDGEGSGQDTQDTQDPQDPPDTSPITVGFSQPSYTVTEGQVIFDLAGQPTGTKGVGAVVTLSRARTEDTEVSMLATGSTAIGSQVDFFSGTHSATIPAGQTQVLVPIKVVDDDRTEQTEQFGLSILSTLPSGVTLRPGASVANVSILDKQAYTACFAREAYTVHEAAGTLDMQLNVSSAQTFPVPLSFAYQDVTAVAAGGQDRGHYVRKYSHPGAERAIIQAGEDSLRLQLDILDNDVAEADRTFLIVPNLPTAQPSCPTKVTILDDEHQVGFVSDGISVMEGGSVKVAVELTRRHSTARRYPDRKGWNISDKPVTFTVTTSHGTAGSGDYTGGSWTRTIPAREIRQTIMIPTTADSVSEGPETFTLSLTLAENQDHVAAGIDAATVTIYPNAAPTRIDVRPHGLAEVTEGSAVFFDFTVHPGPMPHDIMVAYYLLSNGGDFLPDGKTGLTTLTIPAGSDSQRLAVMTDVDGSDASGSVWVLLMDRDLVGDSANSYPYQKGKSDASVLVLDGLDNPNEEEASQQLAQQQQAQQQARQHPATAEPPEVTISGPSEAITEGAAVVVKVMAAPAPTQNLSVAVTVHEESAGGAQLLTETVVVAAGQTYATFTHTTLSDNYDGDDGQVTATVQAGDAYTVGAASSVSVTVADDDDPPVADAPPAAADDAEPRAKQQAVPTVGVTAGAGVTEGGNARFTISAVPAPASSLAVSVTVAQTGDYAAAGATGTQTVMVPTVGSVTLFVATVDDSSDEADGSLTLTVDSGEGYTVSSNQYTATAPIADNDEAAPPDDDTPTADDDEAADDDAPQPAACVTSDAALLTQVQAKIEDPWNGARPDLLDTFTRSRDTMIGADTYTVADLKARPDRQEPNWQGDGPNALWQKVYAELDRLEACREPPPEAPAAAVPEVGVTAKSGVTEGRIATFTITAAPAPESPLTVKITVTGTGDFGAATGARTVTVPTGGAVRYYVRTVDDRADEADGSLTVTVEAADGYTVSGAQGAATAAVADDDATTVTLAGDSDDAVAEDGGTREITLTVGRTLGAGETLTAPLAVSGAAVGDHYTLTLKAGQGINQHVTLLTESPHSAQNPAVAFAAGARQATLLLTAQPNDDTVERTVRVALGAGKRAPAGQGLTGGVTAAGDPLEVAITNDDAPPPPDPPTLTDEDEPPPQNLPTISIGNAQEVEDGLVMEFPVTLSEATAHTVTVDYATEEGTAHESVDYGGVWHSTLRIPPGAIRRTIYVVIVEDVRRERAEAFQVVLSNPTGATIAKGTATGTVIDND